MEFIQSVQNSKVKYWNQLKTKKAREKEGLYLIEGSKLLDEAIGSQHEIVQIIVEEDKEIHAFLNALEVDYINIPIARVSRQVIEKLAETETPQGIIAVLKKPNFNNLKETLKDKHLVLLLDEIQDPGNLGTIIRSADAAGVDAILLGKGTVELYNSKVIRSAVGSIFHLPIIEGSLDSIIPMLKELDFTIIGTSPHANKSYFEVDLKGKIAVMVGNEAKGISPEKMAAVDCVVKIPLFGKAESLNVAMATTLILYEYVRRKLS